MAQKPIRWCEPQDRRPRAPLVPQGNWEQHRVQLRRMYLDEGMKLEAIMEVMKDEHSFMPSYVLCSLLGQNSSAKFQQPQSLSHMVSSKRQYTSQFYTKWGFYKRSGRDQQRTNNVACNDSMTPVESTPCTPAAQSMQVGIKNDEATRAEETSLVSVQHVQPTYPDLLTSLETELPQVCFARQSPISPSSSLEMASPKPESSVEKTKRHERQMPLGEVQQIASIKAAEHIDEDMPEESVNFDSRSVPHQIDGYRLGDLKFSVGSAKDVNVKLEPYFCPPILASSLSTSADQSSGNGEDRIQHIRQDIFQWSLNVGLQKEHPDCSDGSREPSTQDQAFPTLCLPSQLTIDHFPTLSKTLLSSPGSSLSGLSSMISLKNRISQNRVSSEGSSSSSLSSGFRSTSTISPSMLTRHLFQNGRRYHTFGSTKYWGPDDEDAKDVQDLTHHIWCLYLGGQLYSPNIRNPKDILDLGTGTGAWVIDVADKNPGARVEGLDISAIQPDFVPPNSYFVLDDFNDSWCCTRKYDLIHGRELLGCVHDWMEMYRKVYRALKPGGWFNQAEPSIIFCSDHCVVDESHPYSLWNKVMVEAGTRAGMDFEIGPKIESRLKKVGFVNVQVVRKIWPIGQWTKDRDLRELGSLNQGRLAMGIHGLCSRRLMDEMGWSPRQIGDLCQQLRKAFKTPELYSYHWVYHVRGQKPGVVRQNVRSLMRRLRLESRENFTKSDVISDIQQLCSEKHV